MDAATTTTEEATVADGPAPLRRPPMAVLALVVVLALTLPAGAVARFGFDTDRGVTADVTSVIFFVLILGLLSTPWWTGPTRSLAARVQSMCFVWFGITYTTHLSWELGWLALHDRIVDSPDSAWAYLWWMYIDGGDGRYATSDPTLVTMELLSVTNGIIGMTGLWLWWRSRGRAPAATLAFMATAVVHLYSTVVYFGSEILDGYPNVDTGSFVDLWIKFLLLNGLWLVVPWVVLAWGRRTLDLQYRRTIGAT
ncbi:EXPERA domain-containing protein [Actinospongicola halichondriae]|uniref:EXPERA domain-containing protein n=1 Tax=Actinospongicola halichondriae TaxID=3236844 RepID=UPI003D44906C